jgi:hypothetical protein
VEWAESKDFRGCPLQHTVSELTDAAHPARAIAHGQREWFTERFLESTTAAGVKDAKATARALMVLFDGAVAGSEVDGPQRASDARWMAKKLLAGFGVKTISSHERPHGSMSREAGQQRAAGALTLRRRDLPGVVLAVAVGQARGQVRRPAARKAKEKVRPAIEVAGGSVRAAAPIWSVSKWTAARGSAGDQPMLNRSGSGD